MRTIEIIVGVGILLFPILLACKKNVSDAEEMISESVKEKVYALGFSTENIKKVNDGYIVEEDIFLSESDLNNAPSTIFLRIAQNEQYRTYNLVRNLPRTITISLDPGLPATYGPALDETIRRFNRENLQIRFQRSHGTADINMIKQFGNFLASAGFPLANGMPYHTIKLNSYLIGPGSNTKIFFNHLSTIMSHEIGHCIGFRHTDYMDRSFSCGGRKVNEGSTSASAIHIPGTPSRPDSASWMLVCIAKGQSRLFNDNDKIALNYLY